MRKIPIVNLWSHIHIHTNTCTPIPPNAKHRHQTLFTWNTKRERYAKNKQSSSDNILSPYNLYREITTYIKLAFQRGKNKKEK